MGCRSRGRGTARPFRLLGSSVLLHLTTDESPHCSCLGNVCVCCLQHCIRITQGQFVSHGMPYMQLAQVSLGCSCVGNLCFRCCCLLQLDALVIPQKLCSSLSSLQACLVAFMAGLVRCIPPPAAIHTTSSLGSKQLLSSLSSLEACSIALVACLVNGAAPSAPRLDRLEQIVK